MYLYALPTDDQQTLVRFYAGCYIFMYKGPEMQRAQVLSLVNLVVMYTCILPVQVAPDETVFHTNFTVQIPGNGQQIEVIMMFANIIIILYITSTNCPMLRDQGKAGGLSTQCSYQTPTTGEKEVKVQRGAPLCHAPCVKNFSMLKNNSILCILKAQLCCKIFTVTTQCLHLHFGCQRTP